MHYKILKWKWHDIQPSMVTHIQNLCSAFTPSKVHIHSSEHTHAHTRTHTHTHTVNTYPEQWAAIYAAAPGEQLGVRYLAQGHLIVVLRVESGLYIHSPPPPTIPAGLRLELTTFGLRVWLSIHYATTSLYVIAINIFKIFYPNLVPSLLWYIHSLTTEKG